MKKKTVSTMMALCIAAISMMAGFGCLQAAADETAVERPAEIPEETIKIGIAELQSNEEAVNRKNYYENYIAPYYNVEFVFSEAISDSEDLVSFVENCADAGCKGIIGFSPDSPEQVTSICQKYGMMYVVNMVRSASNENCYTDTYDNYASFAVNNDAIAESFGSWLAENASEDGEEGFLLCSAAANYGVQQHILIIKNALKALQDLYGLTYDQDIETMAISSSPIEATNDKGVHIYIYPGDPNRMDGWLSGFTSAIQTNKYAVVLGCTEIYNVVSVAVQEAEEVMDKDVKVACMASLSESLKNAFHTEDRFGNQTLNLAIVKPTGFTDTIGFVNCYNLITGYHDSVMGSDGEVADTNGKLWEVTDAESCDHLTDIYEGNYHVFSYEDINRMLGIFNPDITHEDIMEVIDAKTIDSVLEEMEG